MELASLFSNGAIIQQQQVLNIWGKSIPRQPVKAELAGLEAYTLTSLTGEFVLRFPPLEAGGPYSLTVSTLSEEDKIIISDVLIGEVWLASGQSNMEYRMKSSPDQMKEFIRQNRDTDTLRMFTVKRNAMTAPENTCGGEWKKSTVENIEDFSAVAAWFGNKIRERLKVPIGIVSSCWGGTAIQAWISRNTMIGYSDFREKLVSGELKNAVDAEFWHNFRYDEAAVKFDTGSLAINMAEENPGNKGFNAGWASPDFDDSDWSDFQVPGSWISQNIAGNGAIWGRFTVAIPHDWTGKDLWLDLGGIDKHDTTYFNGTLVGCSGQGLQFDFWDKTRHYLIPAELVKSGEAVIAVRGYSFIYDGAFGGSANDYCLYPVDDTAVKPMFLAGKWKAKAERDFGVITIPNHLPGNPNSYCTLFDGMIKPLLSYNIRGAIWYQGETNAGSMLEAKRYQDLMTGLIKDWRWHWGQEKFPFYLVGLAGYRAVDDYNGDSSWARLRESQRRACLEVPDCAMAVAVDCGEENEIHPHDKKNVGDRLARLVLSETYKIAKIVASGPIPLTMARKNNELHIDFDYIGNGLFFKDGIPKGFFIAGKDACFKKADEVNISGSMVVIKSLEVPEPLYVRYAWADNPDANLFNSENLPAIPFELLLEEKI